MKKSSNIPEKNQSVDQESTQSSYTNGMSMGDWIRSRFSVFVSGLSILFILLMCLMIYLYLNMGESTLIAYAPKDRNMPQKRLINQGLALNSSENVKRWAEAAAGNILSFAFDNIDDHMQKIRPYFTSEGYTALNNSFPGSSLYKSVKKQKYTIEAFSAMPSFITDWDMSAEFPWWKISVPMVLNIKTGRIDESKAVIKMANMYVTYIPLRQTQQVDGEVVILDKRISWFKWFSNLPDELPKSLSKFFKNVKDMIAGTFQSKRANSPCLPQDGCSYTVLAIKNFTTAAPRDPERVSFFSSNRTYQDSGDIGEIDDNG